RRRNSPAFNIGKYISPSPRAPRPWGCERRQGRRSHPQDVVPTIDVDDLAGDTGAEVAEQVEGGGSDVLAGGVAAQRSALGVVVQHSLETADAGGRKGS